MTPKLGCSLADKMTSTMPTMNHSFRSLARRPMVQPLRSAASRLAGPPVSAAGLKTPQLRYLSRGRVLSANYCGRAGTTSGHVGRSATVNTARNAQPFSFIWRHRFLNLSQRTKNYEINYVKKKTFET